MDAELKAKWVAALRSGEYKQTHAMLCNYRRTAFCCLGVLLDVRNPGIDLHDNKPELYGDVDTLIGDKNLRLKLVTLNDERLTPFSEIADYIEKHL